MSINFISKRCVVCLIVALLHGILMFGNYTIAETLSDMEVQKLFAEANTTFNEAMELRLTDQDQANQKFAKCINQWQQIITDGGIINGKLYYNIGNANLMQGKLGQAILFYRKAEQYITGDANLVANLDYARRMVHTRIELQTSSRIREILFFWHYDFSPKLKFLLFSGGFLAAWLWLIIRLLPQNLIKILLPRWPALIFFVFSIAFLGSLITDHIAQTHHDQGVVTENAVVGRKGPSQQGYEPSFSEPLSEGVEFTVVENRSGWILVQLRDGRSTWLPNTALEII